MILFKNKIKSKIKNKILIACEQLDYYDKASLNIDFVMDEPKHIQIALGINTLSIYAMSKLIQNILKQIDMKLLEKINIQGIEIYIYYSQIPFPNRILRFTVKTNSITQYIDVTPEKLRAIKPLVDLEVGEVYCSWSFLKRFPDESDKSWNAFQTHPHCLKGTDIPDFLQIQG